jgi:hypothetical protein
MNKSKIKQHLRRRFSALAVIVALGIGVLCAVPEAQADQPVPVNGTCNLCGHNMWNTFHQAGRNFTIDVYQNQIFSGGLNGTLYVTPEDPEHDVVRLAHDGTLIRVVFHGSGSFQGSVLGRPTSAAAVMTYQGQVAQDGSGRAIWLLDDPVAGIHGHGTLYGNPPDPNPCEGDGYYVTGTLTGQIQLTP